MADAAAPHIVVFDSGLGGLSVLKAIRAARPDLRITYLADTAGFPYGNLSEPRVVRRVGMLMERTIAQVSPDLVVIACNTASTLVLPSLRAAYPIPFVGTVPAVKPAAETTRSGLFSVLATPGTVKRDYTQALIHTFAFHLDVTLVGAAKLAALAEAHLRGERVDDAAILHEIRPAFKDRKGRRTDTIVLACTHYPLIADRLAAVAPWEVTWIDPAPAIARRVTTFLPPARSGGIGGGRAVFTAATEREDALREILAPFGVSEIVVEPLVREAV
ncbi:glutamate racemase [Lutibaculum baratangense]|uniref:Glutamate racemase n=1 Tax=Lutibaculum baratangense AMV1 TaxID=631454 RepID=V4RUR3_9HYPH|nr:glutamate racemase [Lutibaculum baratangense]ESR26815.1 Glutamate racemase [Lutibaculum baratangense AMV1]